MADGRVDDGMIEIGDPTEDASNPDTPPQVVIQYHERGGVPWMLIPPLLVLSAVGAVLLSKKLAPRPYPAPIRSQAGADAGEPAIPAVGVPANPAPPSSSLASELDPPAPKPEMPAVESPIAAPIPSAEPDQVPRPDPAPSPKLQGLGFDPKALDADSKVEAPADLSLAPAVRDGVPDDRDQPREIDPDLLPPDPRQARVRQQQRRLDAIKKVDDERLRFHADVKAICGLKFRQDTAKKLDDLRKRYESRVDPAAETRAAELLGKYGKFAGADRRTRIELLRALGYPEPVILGYLFNHYGSKSLGERDGPSSLDEALYQSAQVLLRSPPPVEASSRPVSNIPGARANRPPDLSGTGAGPGR